MTHELSQAQYAASVGLSPEVLEQAVESATYIHGDPKTAYRMRGAVESAIRIATSAIREALVREMIADIKGTVVVYGESKVELDHVVEWLARYLPAAEDREQEGTR